MEFIIKDADKILKIEKFSKDELFLFITNKEDEFLGEIVLEPENAIELVTKLIEMYPGIRDKFAMEFHDWADELRPSQKVSVWSKNGEYSGLFTMDTEQLLEKFKKK